MRAPGLLQHRSTCPQRPHPFRHFLRMGAGFPWRREKLHPPLPEAESWAGAHKLQGGLLGPGQTSPADSRLAFFPFLTQGVGLSPADVPGTRVPRAPGDAAGSESKRPCPPPMTAPFMGHFQRQLPPANDDDPSIERGFLLSERTAHWWGQNRKKRRQTQGGSGAGGALEQPLGWQSPKGRVQQPGPRLGLSLPQEREPCCSVGAQKAAGKHRIPASGDS